MMALPWSLVFTVLFLSFTVVSSATPAAPKTQTFIVRVDDRLKPHQFPTVEEWYTSTLESLSSTNILSSKNPTTSQTQKSTVDVLHIYKTVFYGFSVKLTPEQAEELKTCPGILSVFPDRIHHFQTTRSPHFLGLDTAKAITGLCRRSDYGSNVIIGLLDSGIWPERHSFDDHDMGPIPSRWKGECVQGDQFPKTLCNKKLIGARYFTSGYQHAFGESKKNDMKSARDAVGHGTHTASIAAGRAINNASFLGFASGEASGIAQKARIAMYKVCGGSACMGSDILAGFDAAVADGVDVISMSLASDDVISYDQDVAAIAAFSAMEKGVFVSASAGNSGSTSGTVANVAPWITSVGAGTIDRAFAAELHLGDGSIIKGSSLYDGEPLDNNTYWPLIYGGNATARGYSYLPSYACFPDSLDPNLVRGKIVICDRGVISRVMKGVVVKKAGGIGTVVANVAPLGEGLVADAYLSPALAVTESARAQLLTYINSTPNANATIVFRGTQVGVKPAPVVASFSSRGPNPISIYVLKPDLIAPGVNILAGYPDGVSPTHLPEDPRQVEFNILSGTSMSCPHVSGIAALLKGAHPDWSPAMIRSALMTTAYTHDQDGNALLDEMDMGVGNTWAMGAGHVDPEKALDPGLVYNLTADDYINFLCASNLSLEQIKAITRRDVNCSEAQNLNPWDLNYPAISVAFDPLDPSFWEVDVTRTVTNVGHATSTYTVAITNPAGIITTVDPPTLMFKQLGETKSYTVKIAADPSCVPPVTSQSEFGQLSWSDGKFQGPGGGDKPAAAAPPAAQPAEVPKKSKK
ncbi:hypothetical protein CCACVL1_22195 [Corchorus capsularis]|uniref:Peptidase S8/S53 domain-containing protein n=1 Tax=Corchorus capsularis TaxID=210143 RepID=A0A1R3H0N0_COCAP|nr:hypothetical protein CCACVL1_22195 [Corchorus capsularis]